MTCIHQLHWSFASAVEVIDAMAFDRKDEDQQSRAFVVVVSDANFRRNSNLVAPVGCRIYVLHILTWTVKLEIIEMDVSKNRGTPKWMVKIMENPIKIRMIWGENPTIFGNTPNH